MVTYSLNVALIIAVSLLFYRTLLQKETFFKLNRIILLCCLVLSFIIPLIHVPASFSFRNAAMPTAIEYTTTINDQAALPVQPVISPVTLTKAIATKTQTPDASLLQTIISCILKYLPFIYWAGVIIMGLNLLLQILVLKYQQYKGRIAKDGIFRIVAVEGDRAPCSFANCIYINPEKYDTHTYNQILQHEKIHVLQGHSFDLVITEIMLVFQWFNVFAWLYRKDIESNLEYLTDYSVLKQNTFERADYQMSLLKVSVPNFATNITTNYNRSFLKKRILMMNSKRSGANGIWKYMTLALIMGILICNINEPFAATASEIVHTIAPKKLNYKNALAADTKQTPALAPQLKNNIDTAINTKLPLATTQANQDNDTASMLKFSNTLGKISAKFEGGRFIMPFPAELINADAAYSNAINSSGYSSLSQIQLDSLKTAGVTADFINDMSALGYIQVPYKMLCILKLAHVTPTYIKSFSDLGYGKLTLSKLISFKFSNIEADYIKSLQRVGLNIPLDLVTMAKMSKIVPEYVKGFTDLGYKDLPFSQISMWKMEGVDADYIKGFNKIGFNDIPASTLSLLKVSNITPEFVTEMKDKGVVYQDLKRYILLKKEKI